MSSNEDMEAVFLSGYLKNIWNELRPDPELVSPRSCALLLKRNPELQRSVQKAYAEGNANILKDCGLPRHPRLMVYNREEFSEIYDKLETMRVPLEKVADGTASEVFLTWKLREETATSEDVMDHIEKLSIPCIYPDSEPLIILHESGQFQSEPKLNERLDHIFVPGKNTFFVNSSGTGKTRLLYEGLCKQWGFFFTAALDSSDLGSTDIRAIVNLLPHNPKFTSVIPSEYATPDSGPVLINVAIAHRYFSGTLLARLLVFKLYVEIVAKTGFQEIHKRRWFFAQLEPFFTNGSDVFIVLQSTICNSKASDALLKDCIKQCIEDIMNIFEHNSPGSHFFIILDEANAVSKRHELAFRGVHGPHTVLKEIIQAWESYLHAMPFTMVVAGTCIPEIYFKEDKWKEWRWISSTGGFDNVEDQRAYILKFLPRDLVCSASGQHLLHRMWVWLRGRHRMTSAFMMTLLVNGFQSPHYLLSCYIHMFTGFWPSDAGEFIRTESPRSSPNLDGIPMKQLEYSKKLRTNMQHLIMRHLISDYRFTPSSFDGVEWITTAFGHFSDNAMSCVSVDEPLVLVAVAQWFSTESFLIPSLDQFLSSHSYAAEPALYAMDYVTFALALSFKTPQVVSEIFTFSTTTPPVWASQRACFVSLRKMDSAVTGVSFEFSPEVASQLVYYTSVPSDVLNWMKDSQGVPFCMHIRGATAILYFVLELEDHSRFCVALQGISTTDGDIEAAVLQEKVEGMTPVGLLDGGESFDEEALDQSFKTLNNQYSTISSVPLLRTLVSLDDKVHVQGVQFERFDKYPVAALNIPIVQDAVKDISQKDVLSSVVTSIISDFKRKPPPEIPISPTRRRLSESSVAEEAYTSISTVPAPKRTKMPRGQAVSKPPKDNNPKRHGTRSSKSSGPVHKNALKKTVLEPRYNLRPRKPK